MKNENLADHYLKQQTNTLKHLSALKNQFVYFNIWVNDTSDCSICKYALNCAAGGALIIQSQSHLIMP